MPPVMIRLATGGPELRSVYHLRARGVEFQTAPGTCATLAVIRMDGRPEPPDRQTPRFRWRVRIEINDHFCSDFFEIIRLIEWCFHTKDFQAISMVAVGEEAVGV
jgi:hypothetical protein